MNAIMAKSTDGYKVAFVIIPGISVLLVKYMMNMEVIHLSAKTAVRSIASNYFISFGFPSWIFQ